MADALEEQGTPMDIKQGSSMDIKGSNPMTLSDSIAKAAENFKVVAILECAWPHPVQDVGQCCE